MEHAYTDSSGRRLRYADGGLYCARPGEEEVYFDILDDRDREILRLAAENQRLTQSSLASSNAFQDDLAALLRAAGLSDRARPASPHQVVQEELLPQVQYLAAREKMLREIVSDLLAELGPLGGMIEPVKRLRAFLDEK